MDDFLYQIESWVILLAAAFLLGTLLYFVAFAAGWLVRLLIRITR